MYWNDPSLYENMFFHENVNMAPFHLLFKRIDLSSINYIECRHFQQLSKDLTLNWLCWLRIYQHNFSSCYSKLNHVPRPHCLNPSLPSLYIYNVITEELFHFIPLSPVQVCHKTWHFWKRKKEWYWTTGITLCCYLIPSE